jgi:hypothetical protein
LQYILPTSTYNKTYPLLFFKVLYLSKLLSKWKPNKKITNSLYRVSINYLTPWQTKNRPKAILQNFKLLQNFNRFLFSINCFH